MPNMSYCRFQNTANDLEDCLNNMDADDLGPDEARARHRIIRLAIDIVAEHSEIDFEMGQYRDNLLHGLVD